MPEECFTYRGITWEEIEKFASSTPTELGLQKNKHETWPISR